MKILKNIFYILFPSALGLLVGFIMSKANNYNLLVKPPLSPPGIIFPIVWSIIFILLGVSFFLYKKNALDDIVIDYVYYISLAVNSLWTIIFFNLRWYMFSIVWIVFLDLLIIFLVKLFLKAYKPSGYLNIFYLLWLLFATYLTFGVTILNK